MGGVDLSDQMIISRPTAIESYNKHMGGVDLSWSSVGPLPLKATTSTWGESTCQTNASVPINATWNRLHGTCSCFFTFSNYQLCRQSYMVVVWRSECSFSAWSTSWSAVAATPGYVVVLPSSVRQPKHASTDNLTMRPSSSLPSRNVLSTCAESTHSTLVLRVMCACARTCFAKVPLQGGVWVWSPKKGSCRSSQKAKALILHCTSLLLLHYVVCLNHWCYIIWYYLVVNNFICQSVKYNWQLTCIVNIIDIKWQ